MVPVVEYDESEAFRAHAEAYWSWYQTDFERLCSYLGARREKAVASGISDFAERVSVEWEARATPAVRETLAVGLEAFRERVRERVVSALRGGSLPVNRCPACHRIVRTPRARQCLWCGHDWHGTPPSKALP